MTTDMTPIVDAYEHTVRALVDLSSTMTDEEWKRPTWLPGWTVADAVAHVVGLDRAIMGEDLSGHELPSYPWVQTPIDEKMERSVDYRRSWTRERVIDDLRDCLAARLIALRDPSFTGDVMLNSPMGGQFPASFLFSMRVFDIWAHEQDVRAAVDRPGNLDSPAARVAFGFMGNMAPGIGRKAALSDQESVVIISSGPVPVRAVIGSEPSPSTVNATITTDGMGLFRLLAGRGPWQEIAPVIAGDQSLAERVLAVAAMTP